MRGLAHAAAWMAAALLFISGCAGGTALRARQTKPLLHGDKSLVDIAAIRAFKGGSSWWAPRYSLESSDRCLFTTCAAPKESTYAVAITFPNCAVFLDAMGVQRAFLATRTSAERLMWASEDGRVLCTYADMKPGVPTFQVQMGTWNGQKLLTMQDITGGDFFLGSVDGFVHLNEKNADARQSQGAEKWVLPSLTFYDYRGHVLGRDSTGVAVQDRSWRASHSPDARFFVFAGSWKVTGAADDSLTLFETSRGHRIWSRALGGRPERVRLTKDAARVIVVAALDDSTHRISILSGKDGRALAEREVRGGWTEDIALSCNGRLAFIAGRGYRALADLEEGKILYALSDPETQLRKASVSNTGEVIAVDVRPERVDRPVQADLFQPDGALYWSTPSEASGPATDVWISPDGRRLFLRASGVLEIYE